MHVLSVCMRACVCVYVFCVYFVYDKCALCSFVFAFVVVVSAVAAGKVAFFVCSTYFQRLFGCGCNISLAVGRGTLQLHAKQFVAACLPLPLPLQWIMLMQRIHYAVLLYASWTCLYLCIRFCWAFCNTVL